MTNIESHIGGAAYALGLSSQSENGNLRKSCLKNGINSPTSVSTPKSVTFPREVEEKEEQKETRKKMKEVHEEMLLRIKGCDLIEKDIERDSLLDRKFTTLKVLGVVVYLVCAVKVALFIQKFFSTSQQQKVPLDLAADPSHI